MKETSLNVYNHFLFYIVDTYFYSALHFPLRCKIYSLFCTVHFHFKKNVHEFEHTTQKMRRNEYHHCYLVYSVWCLYDNPLSDNAGYKCFLFKKQIGGHQSFLWGDPCFGILVISAMGFKARVLACFAFYVQRNPEFHLYEGYKCYFVVSVFYLLCVFMLLFCAPCEKKAFMSRVRNKQ